MKRAKPLIDILMATYNGQRFVGEQIESIQGQTCADWRLLVSDDCSTDKTLDVVRRYAAADGRIQVVSQGVRHGGAKANFFSLMDKSTAPYVMFCDQDDVWLPRKVEKTFEAMRKIEGSASADVPLLVFTDMKVVDGDLNVIAESFDRFSSIDPSRNAFPHVVAQPIASGCTMMVNAAARDLALKAPDTSDVILHDQWLTLLASAFGRIAYVDEPTSLYRQHGSNEIGALKYSPVKRASHFDVMKESVAATVSQARAFCTATVTPLAPSSLGASRNSSPAEKPVAFPRSFTLPPAAAGRKGFERRDRFLLRHRVADMIKAIKYNEAVSNGLFFQLGLTCYVIQALSKITYFGTDVVNLSFFSAPALLFCLLQEVTVNKRTRDSYVALASFALLTVIQHALGGRNLLALFALVFTARGVPIKRVLWTTLALLGISLVVTVFLAKLGIITNVCASRGAGTPLRYGLGFIGWTYSSYFVFVMASIYALLKREKARLSVLALLFAGDLWIYCQTDTRNGFS